MCTIHTQACIPALAGDRADVSQNPLASPLGARGVQSQSSDATVRDRRLRWFDVFGSCDIVARKYKNGEQNKQFNRVLLEVLVYFFDKVDETKLTEENNRNFVLAYKKLFEVDTDFQATIDGSTKNMENYKIRYSRIQDIVNEVYGLKLVSPFEYVEQRVK